MGNPKQALDWIHRMKSSAKPPTAASTPADPPIKSGNQAEWNIDDFKFALDLAKQVLDLAEVAPFVKSAAALLPKIIDSYKELKYADEKCLARHVANITGDICAIVLRLQETDHSDQIGRLKGDLNKYEGLIQECSQSFNDGFSEVQHKAIDELKQELELFHARLMLNRLVQFCHNQTSNMETQDNVHYIGSTFQSPINISGGTGGPGGDGNDTGGAGGTGGGPTVNFITQTEEKLEKWLQFPPDMKQKQHVTEQLHMEGTGQWFLQNKKFIEWEDNPGVLWVEGPSGAGKSVLSSTVIDDLFKQRAQSTPCPFAVAFFYFDFRTKETQSPEIALRRLILQLSAEVPHPYKTLDEHYNLLNGQKLPNYQDLVSLLLKLFKQLQRTYIVLDALDECDSSNFQQLVGLVAKLKAWAETPLHLFITSQTRPIFTESFKDIGHLVLYSDLVDQDIKLFVTNELQTKDDLNAWQANADLVIDKITQKSNGMFRLAACLLTELSCCLWGENDELHEILDKLPNDLFGIYDRFMDSIPKKYFSYVEAALQWIMFNHDWEFTLAKLADAVAFDFSNPVHTYRPNRQETNKSLIMKWLAGLIQVDSWSEITLAHASVQDYLLSGHFKQKFKSDLSEGCSHSFISRSCIGYILHFGDQPLEPETVYELEDKYPLGEYVARYWYHHITQSNEQQTLLSLGMELLQDGSKQYEALYRFHDKSEYLPPLYLCCSKGYLECVSQCIEKGADINPVDATDTPLGVASYWENMDIVQLLLERGADVNLGGRQFGSPLGAASYQGKSDVVQLLLDKGADVNLGGGEYGSPLGAASHRGESDIVQLLLDKGADVNLGGGEYGSPLGAASYWGKSDIVQLLLDKGADVNLGGGEYGSPLGAASHSGKSDIVQLLLDKGADVNLGGGEYGSPLGAASHSGKSDIVPLLLDKGADVNLAGGEYGSPLGAASYNGKSDVVQLLLDKGADVNLGGGEFGSPLGAASHRGKSDIVQLLLDKGADVNLGGGEYGSPLGAASHRGESDIVQLLLDKGADVNLGGGEYGSPLGAASYWGKSDIVQLLLDKGADVNLGGEKYGSPLGAASYWGNSEIVQLLLDKGADVNLGGEKYGSLLGAASYWGNSEIVQLLLDKGADVNLGGGEYGSPLGVASFWGNSEIVQLLLDKGADINLGGGEYGCPLGAASYQGNSEIVQQLLDKGADVNLGGGEYGCPLGAASYQGNSEIVQLLLDKGADVNLGGGKYGSPLGAASYQGKSDIVQLLLDKGADVNLGGGEYGSPLGAASFCGNSEIVQLLLDKGADVNLGGAWQQQQPAITMVH
ncbi:Ankyrin repeat-containing domain protein [Mycena sanguinolenta]|uniref:Ankyrin repeat-containing domain protein n=1 Tax=Mycena sanguinolenta TaxID=230812 RepID=A0A8H7CW55_9AGAR|nr:Ankyrin repeat-containing domain protein [Mycena sanguinolenta]